MKRTLSPLLLSLAVSAPAHAGDAVYNYTDGSRSSTAGGSETGSSGTQNTGDSGQTAGSVTVGLTGSSTGVDITTSNAPGVQANSTGGTGANGVPGVGDTGPGGGNGGAGGDVSVTGIGNVGVTVTGDNAIGVQATSTGGQGGFAGSEGDGPGYFGGYGGYGGNVTVDFSQGSGLISTAGANAFGVQASSVAGSTGTNGTNYVVIDFKDLSNGRHGGNSGTVNVTMGSDMAITTSGTNAIGIVARGVSGNGGDGTSSAGPISTGKGGTGGNGGVTENVSVNNLGTISTAGTGAIGIFAQSITGSGGAGGNSQDVGGSHAGAAGNGGAAGGVSIGNAGEIKTSGLYAPGVLAQSVSGAGGIGGSASGLFDAKGGAGGNTPDGGTITITNTGSIITYNANSQGIVAQSLGGGGGMGGDAGGMINIDGGTGGAGGDGGSVNLSNLAGTISTSNQLSQGAVAQSIGGGGGMGGVATGAGAIGASTVGGNGGIAGAGGSANISTSGLTLSAGGTASTGLLAQSIGGGGGAGGGAYSTSAGPILDIAVAVGGTANSGGNGGTATVTVQDSSISTGKSGQNLQITRNGQVTTVNLPAVDSHGIVAQSVGGGGGNGGAGSAASYAIAIPNGSEDPGAKITFSGAFSTGGSGGSGGSGGHATATISDGSTVKTAGDGSIGVIVHSIGGGGGNGGDSSAMAGTIGYGIPIPFLSTKITPSTNAINVSHSVGGSGGSGGNGGTTTFTLGDTSSQSTSGVTTTGDLAIGALVQSIGGGGGNGGIGNAAVNSWSTSQNADFSIGVGGKGGHGGDGGSANATVNANGVITTHGHGAEGLLAQSIGGGGGVGSGSAVNVTGLDTWATAVGNIPVGSEIDQDGNKIAVGMNVKRTINMAAQGGFGGHSNTVTVTHNGTVATSGIDAAGIVAQSIGGGGGSAGSAGADASTGVLPGVPGTSTAQDLVADGVTVTVPVNITSTINMGTTTWSTGSAGAVKVSSTGGNITTLGDYSTGVIAQSLGGGGGRARVVTVGAETGGALDSASQLSVKTDLNLGSLFVGLGDMLPTLGHGNDVQAVLNGATISTGQQSANGPTSSTPNRGLHAYGILAQSIGGGGGLAIDGSADPNGSATLGLNYSWKGGLSAPSLADGAGGTVTLHIGQGTNSTSIQTYGDGAHGAVLQSIGGGGGVANFGSSALNVPDGSNRKITVRLGATIAGPSTLGSDTVQVTYDQGAALKIATSGNGAFGILAQSISGGGGLVGVSQGVALDYSLIGTQNESGDQYSAQGDAGAISIALPADTVIKAVGTGAHGILAQSIGGGGGVVTSYQYGQTPKLVDSPFFGSTETFGNAGAVTVSTNGQISVSGAGAYGVVAQSIAGSGGLFTSDGNVSLGQDPAGSGWGASGGVAVNVQGSIAASGENGIGVLAQSRGTGKIEVNVGGASPGTVSGGSGDQGVGILVVGGNSGNKVTIGQNSWVWASSGSAIKTVGTYGTQKVDVDNQGQIYGNTWLQGGSISGNFQNPNGTPPGAQSGTLTNAGSLVAMPGKVSYVDGHLIQTAAGRIVPHLDYSNDISGQYVVTGSATLAGTIEPALASAMPNKYLPVFTTEGPTTGTLHTPDSPLFAYTTRQTGNRRDVAITGTHFNAPALGLNKHKGGVAHTLENVFASSNAALGPFFAGLDAAARSSLADYRDAIGELSPRSTMTLLSRVAADASRIADASMSCPEFASGSGQADAILVEGECGYVTVRGNTTSLSGDSDRGSSRLKSFALQGGGQREVGAGLLLGGSLAYQADSFSSHDGVSADGNSVQGAITLKKNLGAWQVSGALFGNYGEFDTKRHIGAPGFSATAKGEAPMYSLGVRGRIAYTTGTEQLYLRPSVNLDLVHAHSNSFNEKGAGDLGLKIASSSYNTAILTPEIEVGGRIDLKGGSVLRTFALAGVSLRSNDEWEGRASFIGGERSPSFGMQAPLDRAALRLGAGAQLYANKQVDFQIRYDAELGSEAKSHNIAAKFAYRF